MVPIYENEEWVALFQAALTELSHALMAGRIESARGSITARLEKLHTMPELHTEERLAIESALNMLRSLEREELRFADEEKKRLLLEARRKLSTLAPRFGSSGKQPE
jgi:hypothetical protein